METPEMPVCKPVKSEECSHKKYRKWQEISTVDGIALQQRICKKCGWTESATSNVYKPSILKSAIKEVVIDLLKDYKLIKD